MKSRSPWKGQFSGKGAPIVFMGTFCGALSKVAELIAISFQLWTRVGARKHALDGGTLALPDEYD